MSTSLMMPINLLQCSARWAPWDIQARICATLRGFGFSEGDRAMKIHHNPQDNVVDLNQENLSVGAEPWDPASVCSGQSCPPACRLACC